MEIKLAMLKYCVCGFYKLEHAARSKGGFSSMLICMPSQNGARDVQDLLMLESGKW